MRARYLVRFDDVSPTMNWAAWDRVQTWLDELAIRPIVAVVPDNQDPQLECGPARADFWDRVRAWQAAGWFVALHGYQHRYVTREPGLVGLNPFSEFAGLPHAEQLGKVQDALRVFAREGVRPDGWVAPGHSFDAVTVRVLHECGIDVISDGFFTRRVRHLGATWLPQQLWRFRRMPAGLWTVCLHTNTMDDAALASLRKALHAFAPAIRAPHDELREAPAPELGMPDLAFQAAWRAALRLRRQQPH